MELPRPLLDYEVELVQSFTTVAERMANSTGIVDNFDIYSICSEAGIDIRSFPKEGILIQAFWVSFLSVLRAHLQASELKYQSIEEFTAAYPGCFPECPPDEMQNLLDTANWMNILFRYVPAKKNKGLAIAIVPKLVEGWMTKYVTGSGQKRSTANRVLIFETEGQVKPNQRGKIRSNIKPSAVSSGKPPSAKHIAKSKSKSVALKMAKTKRGGLVVDYRHQKPIFVKKQQRRSASSAMDMDYEARYASPSPDIAVYSLSVPTAAASDFTTDTESSEEILRNSMEDRPEDLDWGMNVTSDAYFTYYKETMLIDTPDATSSVMETSPMVEGNEDVDFAEVLRLIREPSTPSLKGSLSGMNLSRVLGSSKGRDFTSPLPPAQPTCMSPAPISAAQSNISGSQFHQLKRSFSNIPVVQDGNISVVAGDDTDMDDDMEEWQMEFYDEGYAQYLSPHLRPSTAL